MKKAVVIILVVVAIIAGAMYLNAHNWLINGTSPEATTTVSTHTLVNAVKYQCDPGKTIAASYYDGSSTPSTSPDQPPMPGGTVALTLSDGRTMTLNQTVSADGGRYASADGSIVFWDKGNGAAFTENNQETFGGCMVVANDPGGLPQVYASSTAGFSLRYPANYTVNENYKYEALGPGKTIPGIAFKIDPAIATGTNLGADSYISVEKIPNPSLASCSADKFLDSGSRTAAHTLTDGNMTYSVASSSGAGAGNRYDETVYAIPGTNPCLAIRYFIHSSVFENYPAGTVTRFDEGALTTQFDAIRRSLVIVK